jgi:hypothetical protein
MPLRQFVELESVPMRQRRSAEFKARDRELAERLGLMDEWFCMVCSVLDRESAPCHPEGYARNDAWRKVRAVRKQLLAAAGLGGQRPARASQTKAACTNQEMLGKQ